MIVRLLLSFGYLLARLTPCRATALFVDVPSPSISWIYASIGCQHTLQPTSDDFKPPTIPSLTTRGFVRWQSIEILLGPEEHVPFIQNAVRNFAIKNPDTGDTFPVDLPTEAFPLVADKDIEKWHNACAEKLRQRATPNEDDEGRRPNLPPRPKVRTGMAYVRPGGRGDYFEPKSRSRPIPYQHVSATATGGPPVRPKLSRSPSHQARQFLAPEAPSSPYSRGRRRSFPENVSSPSSPLATDGPPQPAVSPMNSRRHSHPRHARRGSRSSDASSSSEGDGDPPSPKNVNYGPGVAAGLAAGAAATRRRSHPPRDEPPIIRFPPPPTTAAGTPTEPRPSDARPRRRISRDRAATALSEEEEAKRQSFAIPIDLTGKLSAPFLLGNRGNGVREKRNISRGPTVTWKDLSSVQVDEAWRRGSRSSEEDRSPKISRKSSRHENDREGREKEKDRDSGSSGSRRRRPRERDVDVEPVRPLLRERRYSSHEDVMRRHRDREHDREREREAVGRVFRDRDRDRERRGASPARGVDGRKYPPTR
jgi:MYXO-CTERM domain-containing protein